MKINKILLIHTSFREGFYLNSVAVPLGLSYIGAVLENNGFKVKGINLEVEELRKDIFKEFDLVGIYATSKTFNETLSVAEIAKRENPNIFVVVGGPHATVFPEDFFNTKKDVVDAVVVGEGEYIMQELVNAWNKGNDISRIPGVVCRKDGKVILNPQKPTNKDIDELPLPAKHIFNMDCYPDRETAYSRIIASRGCPFRCANCQPCLDNIGKYRRRSPEKVVDELEYLVKKYKVRHFVFSDSELTGPKSWTSEFCDRIKKKKLSITFNCNARVDQLDKALLKKFYSAGCIYISYGIESGSQRVIDEVLHKNISLNSAREIIAETVKAGIHVGVWFMVGMPGEKPEEVLQTINYAKDVAKLGVLTVEMNVLTPWPGTEFYNIAKQNKWLVSEDWNEYNEKKGSVIRTPYLTPEQINDSYNIFKKDFANLGWKQSSDGARFYHPHFTIKMMSMGLRKLFIRGIRLNDIKQVFNLVMKKYE
ncbi:MAG: radical SAM protein [Elusimicrobia bacterium]|nr:radical SAM protein [Elusimicrobiota bacterium]